MNKVTDRLMNELGFPKENIPVCVETGTHRGWSSVTFLTYFKKVYTIELSIELFNYCKKTYSLNNLEFLLGHSPVILKDLIKKINENYFLFLDAHGSGGDTTFHPEIGLSGSPALLEILACKENQPSYIVIDDLIDFKSRPSYPKESQIIDAVKQIGDYEKSIIDLYRGWLVFKKK